MEKIKNWLSDVSSSVKYFYSGFFCGSLITLFVNFLMVYNL